MAQFDVYYNPNPDSRAAIPYLLDVQADLLNTLSTHVVVPLVPAPEMPKPAIILNPSFEIEGENLVMSTPELAGVPLRALGDKVASLHERRDEIMAALDFLLSGI